ncbi:hypothetical protein [Paraflavitalea speifideaquila]|uniref:hypothetical protein n=1 Tax=Paraflavitalea speifideaquila TaxID=3076558 RepID=UPI0028E34CA5|nr:hypothetical protein [Paraflavitalea speifideiaquila]
MTPQKRLRRIRAMILFFVIMLVLSGITAFPVYTQLKWAMDHEVLSRDSLIGAFLYQVWLGVKAANDQYPFLFYGFDWLAFAHIVIGMAFIGPYRDPVRNIWVIEWAMLACVVVFPLALIAGPIRGIPWFHILIDCCFGVFGLIPLWITRKWIKQLAAQTQPANP